MFGLFAIASILISPRTHQSQPHLRILAQNGPPKKPPPKISHSHRGQDLAHDTHKGGLSQEHTHTQRQHDGLNSPHHTTTTTQLSSRSTKPHPLAPLSSSPSPPFSVSGSQLSCVLLPPMANASLQSFLLPHDHSFAGAGGSRDGSASAVHKLSTNTSGSISFRLYTKTSPSVTAASATNSSAPTPVAPASAPAAGDEEEEEGPSLDLLRRQLAAGDYRQADETTRALIIDLAGEPARRRGYVFFSEVQFIPAEDLAAIDGLWKEHSGGRFGYSVQRRLWEKSRRDFTRFFIRVGWMRKLDTEVEQYNYRAFPDEFLWELTDDTPEGHLPLTNALRGTQLLANILTHPAFQEEDQRDGAAAAEESANTKDDNKGRERPRSMRDFKPDYSF